MLREIISRCKTIKYCADNFTQDFGLDSYLSLAAFTDWGEVDLAKSCGQHRNLAGWGVGVEYAKPNDYFLRLDYARKLDGEKFQSEAEDKNGRLWFLAYKLF